jgi:voltage-gated potassium channel
MGDYANHVVICGYDDTTDILLELVAAELDLDEMRVVVFEDRDRPRGVSTDVLWVQGDPTKESELDKVRITHANAVIVVGSRSVTPQSADARTILITFTIRSYLKKHAERMETRRAPIYIVSEILDSENVDHARTAGADEVFETRKVGFSMLAHTIRYHGTADTMSRVLTSGEHNAYVGLIPDAPEEPIRYGDLLARLELTKRGGLIIGLRPPGGKDIFNPSKDHLVVPGTHLVYLAELPILQPPD